MWNKAALVRFVAESNKIEGIIREPLDKEVDELLRFLKLDTITVEELEAFVKVYQPDARLRDDYGLDVQVGNHIPPGGSPEMRQRLEGLLTNRMDAYNRHICYEAIHPFTDCNGRSGRALWAWQMQDISLGFLHMFYYQALDHSRVK